MGRQRRPPSKQLAGAPAEAPLSRSGPLTVLSATLVSLTINPTSVFGGASAAGTVTLTGAAGPTGDVVNLESDMSVALVPASVSVPAGLTKANFTISTVGASGIAPTATISATFGATRPATLNIMPSPLTSVSVSPVIVVGGNPATGTVHLSGQSNSGPYVVSLSSSDPSVIVPAKHGARELEHRVVPN